MREEREGVPLDGLLAEAPAFAPAVRDALIDYLFSWLTPRRRERIDAVLARRTRWLTVVLEDIFQPHNGSAVLRSAECFGLQEVHVVEVRNTYRVSRDVAMGASRWLDLVRWRIDDGGGAAPQPGDAVVPPGCSPLEACCDALEARGYRLVAATPDEGSVSVDDLDVAAGPIAVLFGTELEGLTPAALARATESVHVPMHGFTESFNISVSAALILRELRRRLRANDLDTGLEAEDRREVLLRWLRRSVRHSEQLIAHRLKELELS